ncbi:hypothetical protein SanaruYs_21780 [Chryseotalea sanaruensis]|uniref:Uncharacterized protein n=1 Tax=Chryseotalea sanaruensis TaxID=2482724 RepID=A0A401UAN8_9BACT|nr:hypothetical protein SanaruYs_21780 [Chryseotalea sanaruensis]
MKMITFRIMAVSKPHRNAKNVAPMPYINQYLLKGKSKDKAIKTAHTKLNSKYACFETFGLLNLIVHCPEVFAG